MGEGHKQACLSSIQGRCSSEWKLRKEICAAANVPLWIIPHGLSGKETHSVTAQPTIPAATLPGKTEGCFYHPFIKVFGDAHWQDTHDPLGEGCFWGLLGPYFSKHWFSVPIPLPICLCPASSTHPCPPHLSPSREGRRLLWVYFPHWHIQPQGPGEESSETERERINLFPSEHLPQLADSLISPGLLNIPFILTCCLFIKYSWKEIEFWIIGQ